MDNSEIIQIFLQLLWSLKSVLMNACNDSFIISSFFIAFVKEAYCYAVTDHKQELFVSERLLIQTHPEKKHMP